MTNQTLAQINNVLTKYPVKIGYLFGSYAKDQAGPLSDLDLAIYTHTQQNMQAESEEIRGKVQDEIEKLLKMPDKVDVVLLNTAPPLLEREVVYDGKLIYNQDDAWRAHYEAMAMGRWLDWKWYQDYYDQAVEKQFGKPL